MKIKSNKEYAIASMDILGVNEREMRQMHELKTRVKNVLDSHKDENKKNEYLSDEDLKLVHAILSVFTKEYANTQSSAFDDFLKTEEEKETPCAIAADEEPKETLIKGGPSVFENYMPGESANF